MSITTIFLSQFAPTPVGHGGNHRSYQIVNDLHQLFGESNVVIVSWPEWKNLRPTSKYTHSKSHHFVRHLKLLAQIIKNLIIFCSNLQKVKQFCLLLFSKDSRKLIFDNSHIKRTYADENFVAYYETIVRKLDKPAFCVIEHAYFIKLIEINKRYGIKTVICVQNIESLDTIVPLDFSAHSSVCLTALEFADEMQVLSQCDERLFISKVETAFINGLGLLSHYYPYRPVNAIRHDLMRIRQSRTLETIISGLFLMLGSAAHNTTDFSFSWFLENAKRTGLPKGVRVIIAGSKTEQLLPQGVSIPGIELKGWITQEELNNLFLQTHAMLIPQLNGFGALTRIPEISCAGLVGIVSKHPTYAVDLPPGIVVVDDNWDAWYQKMAEVANQTPQVVSELEYCYWESHQRNPIELALKYTECEKQHALSDLC